MALDFESKPSEPPVDNVWLEYFKVERPTGNTFDPLSYLVACRRDTPGNDKDWEPIYAASPASMAYDLIGLLKTYYTTYAEGDLVEPMMLSIERIAETLPVHYEMAQDAYGTKNSVLAGLFWTQYHSGLFGEAEALYKKHSGIFAEETLYAMHKQLKEGI